MYQKVNGRVFQKCYALMCYSGDSEADTGVTGEEEILQIRSIWVPLTGFLINNAKRAFLGIHNLL